ncbi:NUDIX domain-containing protein [Brachybacterium alimentarium]|uniref:NUDIX domain-containing protein n=1 Tax=Brachybacterium alimentarium TaxID=47845 RepID=UPI003FD04BDD
MTSPESLADLPGARPVSARETVHHGMVFDIVRDTVEFAPGVRFDREYMRHPGAVAVLAVDDHDRILLIRQYRHPVGHTLWEIPAGLLDVDGEPPQRGALRELAEETGHRAEALSTLVDLRPSPGGSDEVIRIYLATGAVPLRAEEVDFERTDEEAEIETRWVPLADAVAGVLEGRLTNATTVVGVLALQAQRSARDAEALRPADAPFVARPGRDLP